MIAGTMARATRAGVRINLWGIQNPVSCEHKFLVDIDTESAGSAALLRAVGTLVLDPPGLPIDEHDVRATLEARVANPIYYELHKVFNA